VRWWSGLGRVGLGWNGRESHQILALRVRDALLKPPLLEPGQTEKDKMRYDGARLRPSIIRRAVEAGTSQRAHM
jgi:hypothetical protein